MNCQRCGVSLIGDEPFCPRCGLQLKTQESAAPERLLPEEEPHEIPGLLGVVVRILGKTLFQLIKVLAICAFILGCLGMISR